jgi:hypothetical protein
MSVSNRLTSPLALLHEWQERADEADLHDLILLGFTVDLPFLEKVAIPVARAMNARITVVGDAHQASYDPVDVRMAGRAYFHALASCGGAFHPKLALLIGEHDVVAAIGSGNPTMAGWGHNDEIWTVLRGGTGDAAPGLIQLGDWLRQLPERVSMPSYVRSPLHEAHDRLHRQGVAHDGSTASVHVLNNLDDGLLDQLPQGPVDELCLFAPFIDQNGTALEKIVRRFDPARMVLGIQERWTSYDGDAILGAAGGREIELRALAERVPRHGKLLEWEKGGVRRSLTGSANLTSSALLLSTAEGGNCELAVLADTEGSLMPSGTIRPAARLQGARTVRPFESRPTLLILGALLTGQGLHVTLGRRYDADVGIRVSPDGSPGSWTTVGTIPAGDTERLFAVPEAAGAAVKAVCPSPDGSLLESSPVFAVLPRICVRRQTDDNRPRLRRVYSEDEIFTDDTLAQRFRYDLLRLAEQLARHRTTGAGVARPNRVTAATGDRWSEYLDECERTIGRPLTSVLFGKLVTTMPEVSSGLVWGLDSGGLIGDEESGEDEPGDEETGDTEADSVREQIPAKERAGWRRWIGRAVDAVAPPAGGVPPPLIMRILIARLFVQLLGHGIWEWEDETWRDDLARLTIRLVPQPDDDVPEEAIQHLAALTAVCLGLLRSEAALTGGSHKDILAARTWEAVRPHIASADGEMAAELLFPSRFPRGRVLDRSSLDDLLRLAGESDPLAPIRAELSEGWSIEFDEGLHIVTGDFTNPVPVAARVATLLGEHMDITLVYAQGRNQRAFVAWQRPHLLLASAPRGNAWRLYRVQQPATPESRLAAGEGITSVGLVGRPVRLGLLPPSPAQDLLDAAGADPADLVRRLAGPS